MYKLRAPCSNLILTNIAFVPTELMRAYTEPTEGPIAQVRAHVDNTTNCNDIGINYVAAALGMDLPVRVHSAPVEIIHRCTHLTSPPTPA